MPCPHVPNPTDPTPDHGPRLSAEEFERRVVALYQDGSAMPDRAEESRLRRAEFDLAIDHRLGVDFPADRRGRLWAAQQRVDHRRLWYIFKGAFARSGDPSEPLTRALVNACADELDQAELRRYFELSASEARRLLGR